MKVVVYSRGCDLQDFVRTSHVTALINPRCLGPKSTISTCLNGLLQKNVALAYQLWYLILWAKKRNIILTLRIPKKNWQCASYLLICSMPEDKHATRSRGLFYWFWHRAAQLSLTGRDLAFIFSEKSMQLPLPDVLSVHLSKYHPAMITSYRGRSI